MFNLNKRNNNHLFSAKDYKAALKVYKRISAIKPDYNKLNTDIQIILATNKRIMDAIKAD